MPLVAEVGWTKDGNAANVSAIEKFSGNQSGFNGLADTDIIGDE